MPEPAIRAASGDLLGKLVGIVRNGHQVTAEERHRHMVEVFRAAGAAQIEDLLRTPGELALASAFVHAVLDELDERRLAAAAEVRDVLGAAASLIVGWPE